MLVINSRIKIPLTEFQFTFSRSSGPGGQNVNKVNTKVLLRWDVTGSPSLPEGVRVRFLEKYPRRITNEGDVIVTSQRFRDQGRNVADATEKLRAMLADAATVPKARRKSKPTRGSRERRLKHKREQSEKKSRRQGMGD